MGVSELTPLIHELIAQAKRCAAAIDVSSPNLTATARQAQHNYFKLLSHVERLSRISASLAAQESRELSGPCAVARLGTADGVDSAALSDACRTALQQLTLSSKQQKKLIKKCSDWVNHELKPALDSKFHDALPAALVWSLDPASASEDADQQTLLFNYPSAFGGNAGYVRQTVKIRVHYFAPSEAAVIASTTGAPCRQDYYYFYMTEVKALKDQLLTQLATDFAPKVKQLAIRSQP